MENPFNAKLRIKKMLGNLPEFYREYDASEIAREAIESPDHSAVVIVCDASAPVRSLNFALQTLSVTRNAP